MSDKPSDLGKTPADAVKRLRANALECLGTRIGLHLHAEADAVEALLAEVETLRADLALARDGADTLSAEVAELRAELAAERGEEEGALPGWTFHAKAWSRDFLTVYPVTVSRSGGFGPGWAVQVNGWTERQTHASPRAAMRAAEAEARRLGLIGEVPRG